MEERFIVVEMDTKLDFDVSIREILDINEVYFDPDTAHLFGLKIADFGRKLQVAIYNPKFDSVPEGDYIPVYGLEAAKEKFPFLFRTL